MIAEEFYRLRFGSAYVEWERVTIYKNGYVSILFKLTDLARKDAVSKDVFRHTRTT